MRILINLLVLFCLLTTFSYAQSFINISAEPNDSFNAVLVEKSGKWLHLIKVEGGDAKVIESFQVMTGRVNGDKISQGDEKTPEGLYFVTGFLSPEKLRGMYGDVAKQYGEGAYPLSYPNFKDRLQGKTGGGIWLHGIDPARADNVTKGCVAFENDKLRMLSDYIGVGTPVVITDEGVSGAVQQIRDHFNQVRKVVADYVDAWEGNDFDGFKKAYHSGFKSAAGQKLPAYLAYKKSLMDIFPYRKVTADNFRIFSISDKESVAEFSQFYCAPNVISYGKKRFYLEKEEGALRITAEEFMPESGIEYVRKNVNDFLISWQKSWEGLKINDYMNFYSDKFSSKGMDKAAWKADKSGKFADLKDVKVEIDRISFTEKSPVSFSIEFRQKYTGDSYSDVGIKTLNVEGCPGDFKIVSEYWRAE